MFYLDEIFRDKNLMLDKYVHEGVNRSLLNWLTISYRMLLANGNVKRFE